MSLLSRSFCSIFTALSLLLFSSLAYSNNNTNFAKLPYDSLLQLQEKVSEGLSPKQKFFLHIVSDDTQIKPSDIFLELISNEEKIEIKIDHRGFFDLPIRKDLVGKEAFVVSNQPKGSLLLQVEISSQVQLQNKQILYSDLMSPITTVNLVNKTAQDHSAISPERYLKSLHLQIDQETSAPVIIRFGSNQITKLSTDKDGVVLIPYKENWLSKNPVVEFPTDQVFHTKPWE
jgi:hypothetical protein